MIPKITFTNMVSFAGGYDYCVYENDTLIGYSDKLGVLEYNTKKERLFIERKFSDYDYTSED